MIRKLLLPLAAGVLLAGCVTTAPYGYRGGDRGDYYYGQPSVDYRNYGSYGYGPYGYDPYYGPYRPGVSIYGRIGSPYGYYGRPYYGGGYYGYPYGGGYYGYPYHGRPRHVHPGTGGGTGSRPDHGEGGGWRNIDEVRRRHGPVTGVTGSTGTAQSDLGGMPRRETHIDAGGTHGESPRMRNRSGSGFGDMIRRTHESRDTGAHPQEE